MWQAKEAEMRFKMHTLKTNTNPAISRSKRRKHKLTKVETKTMAYTHNEYHPIVIYLIRNAYTYKKFIQGGERKL